MYFSNRTRIINYFNLEKCIILNKIVHIISCIYGFIHFWNNFCYSILFHNIIIANFNVNKFYFRFQFHFHLGISWRCSYPSRWFGYHVDCLGYRGFTNWHDSYYLLSRLVSVSWLFLNLNFLLTGYQHYFKCNN